MQLHDQPILIYNIVMVYRIIVASFAIIFTESHIWNFRLDIAWPAMRILGLEEFFFFEPLLYFSL